MVGRPQTRARREAASQGDGLDPVKQALPTPRRTQPADYDDDLAAEVIALGEHGLSESEMASHLALSLGTLSRWRADNPDFATAMERALTAAQGWWESKVRIAILEADTRFPVGAWAACVKARFPGYGDKIEVAHTFDVTSRLVMLDLRTPEQIASAEPAPVIEGHAVALDLEEAP